MFPPPPASPPGCFREYENNVGTQLKVMSLANVQTYISGFKVSICALSVWDHTVTKSNIAKLESVQRRADRACCSNYHQISIVTLMLLELGWEDFPSRQDQNKATVMYRILNNLIAIPAGQYMIATGIATREHPQ